MRLIDADALIEDIRKRPYIDKALCEIFETITDDQPTVDGNKDIAEKIYDAVTHKLIDLGTDLDVNQSIQEVILDFIYK